MSKKRIFSIIGVGNGQIEGLTEQAEYEIKMCDIIISTDRIAKSLSSEFKVDEYKTGELVKVALETKAEHIGILVSGDTGFFSAAKSLHERLKKSGTIRMICGLNSMQMLCSKFGVNYDDAYWLSLHGRKGTFLGAVSYNKKVIVLTGGEQNAQGLCKVLVTAGLGDLRVCIGENIGGEDERIVADTAQNLSECTFCDLVTMFIENPNAVSKDIPVFDKDMERGKVPMTKQEARWTAVQMLNIKPTDVVYDIGAGTGSVSMEIAKKAFSGVVYAIERSVDGIELIEKNRHALGCFNVLPVEDEALNVINKLPMPNAVFIGGSDGQLKKIIERLKKRNKNLRVVISAVSLETFSEAQDAIKTFDVQEIVQIHAVRGENKNEKTNLKANNPIYLLYGALSS